MVAYKGAVEALDGCHCTVALEMAQEARSKLGDSAEVGTSESNARVTRTVFFFHRGPRLSVGDWLWLIFGTSILEDFDLIIYTHPRRVFLYFRIWPILS